MKLIRRLLLTLIVLAALAGGGRLMMPFMARRLVRSDPLVPADLIVVLGSYRLERTLEAGSLFQEGLSPRILLLRSADVENSGALRRLGVRVPVFIDIQKLALAQMGVPPNAITESSKQDSTRTESAFVADYARRMRYRRVLVVTSPYHTGRAGSFFRADARGTFQVIMRPNRYEVIDPDHWWRRPGDRGDVVMEYLKILYAIFPPDDEESPAR